MAKQKSPRTHSSGEKAFETKCQQIASGLANVNPSNIQVDPKPTHPYIHVLDLSRGNNKDKQIIGCYSEKEYFELHSSHPIGRFRVPITGGKINKVIIDNMIRSAILDTPK
jgi:hypothetical protein